MSLNSEKSDITQPKDQLNLYGYKVYFDSFIKTFKSNKLPNVMLLSGPKGSGKATFSYHFINYILSKNEKEKYSVENFEINSINSSFKMIQNFTHPNFFLIENDPSKDEIKIEQIRRLTNFLSKSNISRDIKLILLDNAELLNLNSSNALLRVLEEPKNNTYFFLIHNDSSDIIKTIKSRSLQFRFHFNLEAKEKIFFQISKNYNLDINKKIISDFLRFETPGNLLRYLTTFDFTDYSISNDELIYILSLIEKYRNKTDINILNFISLLIERFYTKLALKNVNNINLYSKNKNKISILIDDMKKFNLDKKSLLFTIDDILKNEQR